MREMRKLTPEEYRKIRVQNLEANANNQNQTILAAVNKYSPMLQHEISMIPAEFREMPETAAQVIGAFVGACTIDDFYDYSYEEEMLPKVIDLLARVIRMMRAATDALIEQLQDLQHNYDPTDEDREEKIHILQQLVTRFENMTDEAAHVHASEVAETAAKSVHTYQFEHYAEFMKILNS